MTIITKSTAKKADTGVLPLFHGEHQVTAPPPHNGHPIIVAAPPRRVSYPCRALFFLIFVAMTVLLCGIIGSTLLAGYYGNQHTERLRFQCRLPYHSEDLNRQALFDFGATKDLDDDELRLANTLEWMNDLTRQWTERLDADATQDSDSEESSDDDGDDDDIKNLMDRFFNEQVELDMGTHPDDEGVTKIEVPDMKDGRTGRFLHDFSYNQTAIVDKSARRCFLMPLDREMVLPPTSFRDMMQKMVQGKYNLDMEVIKKNMRVVLPAMQDFGDVSPNIMAECGQQMRVYKLEKFVRGVFKRSAELETDAKFGAFFGHMVQYDLHNINEVDQYEALAEKK